MRTNSRLTVRIRPGAVLLLGVLCFVLEPNELLALLLAVSVHELGHLAALAVLGAEVRSITAEASGLNITSTALRSAGGRCAAALAGPAAGLLLFFLLRPLGYPLAAELSFLLSAVNLLPVHPLDGGTALHALTEGVFGPYAAFRTLQALGTAVPLLLLCLGLLALRRGYGAALLAFGGWILLLQPEALVKPPEMM